MSRDEKGDRMRDRLSKRFEGGDNQDNTDNLDKTGKTGKLENPEKTENADKVDNSDSSPEIDPKEEWTGRMVYVPDGDGRVPDILDGFDGEYQRLDYECDWDVRKQLHYYPVLIEKGIDQLREMDGDEFTVCVDELQLR